MQTFLPYPGFNASALVLDNKRLGKQRVEAMQILNTLRNGGGWSNHPAVKMWRGYEEGLIQYGYTICREWALRGFNSGKTGDFFTKELNEIQNWANLPPWLGKLSFHISHRSNLVRKFPEHYRLYWPDVPDYLPYVWPV